MIRLTMPKGAQHGGRATVSFMDGEELPAVFSVQLSRVAPQEPLHAFIEMQIGELDVTAIPFLGVNSLREAARLQGYRLVKMEDGE